jgi:hypothetical protein
MLRKPSVGWMRREMDGAKNKREKMTHSTVLGLGVFW